MKIKLLEKDEKLKSNWKNKIIIISKEEICNVFDKKADKDLIENFNLITSNRIESYGDNFLATFNVIYTDLTNNTSKVSKIGLYSDFKTFSIYVTDNKEQISSLLNNAIEVTKSHSGALLQLIKNLTENDYLKLESLENELSAFDNILLNKKNLDNAPKKISNYKKLIIRYKHQYEQLGLIIDFLTTHKDNIDSNDDLKTLAILRRRIPRIHDEVINLRDVLSEIRDNYQTQLGLKTNNLMKMFTIITAIFMPLQLITGWYGMNFKMPEFAWQWSYLIVTIVSISIVVGLLIWFKVKKWFK